MENKTDDSFFIYAIILEHEHILLHASLTTDIIDVKHESEQMYEIAQLHKPVAILDMICHTKDLSLLDYYVKKYMLQYGIFYVRGGSYYEPILPEHLLKTLDAEFKTVDCYKKKYKNPENIVPKYSQEYIKLNDKYKKLKEFVDANGETYCITRDVIKEFEWISEKINFVRSANLNLIDYENKNGIVFYKNKEHGCVSYFEFDEHNQSMYNSVIYHIYKIIETFFTIYKDNDYKIYENQDKKTIVNESLQTLSNYDNVKINELLNNTEFFIYAVINHLDELEFNLSTLL